MAPRDAVLIEDHENKVPSARKLCNAQPLQILVILVYLGKMWLSPDYNFMVSGRGSGVCRLNQVIP